MNKIDEYMSRSMEILEDTKKYYGYGYKSFAKDISNLLKEYPIYATEFFAVQKEVLETLSLNDYGELRQKLLDILNK